MNRFKTSKFKNSTPKIPKKDGWIGNIRAGAMNSLGNHIKSSCRLVAFNTEQSGGGLLGLSSLDAGDDGKWTVSQFPCHSNLVTDFDFSPFDDNVLATCSADETVSLGLFYQDSNTLSPGQGRLETVLFHPSSSGLLAVGSASTAQVWDTGRDLALAALEPHADQLYSFTWKQDGSVLATTCKDKKLRIFDPRAQLSPVQSAVSFQTNKESHILWVKDSDHILTTGFNQVREREVRLWDSRKLGSSLGSVSLGTSSAQGRIHVLTELLIFVSFLVCPSVSHCLTESSTRGIAMVPKLALDVASCEVLRVLQLTDKYIVPVSYHVPRKVGQDFHEDLYPDTVGQTAATTAEEWWKGENRQVQLDCGASHLLLGLKLPSLEVQVGCSTSSSPLTSPSSSAAPSRSPSSTSGLSSGFLPSPSQSTRAIQSMLGPSSKFRHVQGSILHRDTHITNLRGLNLTTPGESDGFCANRQRVAVPLAIAGGQIAVFELSRPGKLPDTALPTIQNTVSVADLAWDPFDPHRLAVAGDDAKIRVWQVPDGGLTDTRGRTTKNEIYSISFHPLASGLLATSSYDMSVRLWNLSSGQEVKVLKGHQDQIFGMAWSPDGQLLATVCKDGKVRIYDPRRSDEPTKEGPGPEGPRGARVVWVCGGQYLLVSGFDSRSERQLYLYSTQTLSSGPIATTPADVSPSTLIPFYDPDTSLLFLTGKGDTRVYIFEILPDSPYFLECSSFSSSEPHKGFSFLPKTECDVRDVEIARALKLTKNSIEPVAFRVPRVKKEFFQDDIFPDTAVCWESTLTGSAWLSGSNGQHRKMSLRPKDMAPVSEAPKDVPVRKYLPSSVYLDEKTDEQKKEELLSAMVAKLGNREDPLPQESFQGVDDEEWDD
uniref:Coronin n=1 Tax=Scleropages formosus TaxID=113540 RepID=A0A8C9TQZ6_SCLFO